MSSQEMNHIELSCVSFEHEGSRNLKKQSVLLTPRAQSNRTVLVNSIGHPRVSFDVSFIVFSRQLGPLGHSSKGHAGMSLILCSMWVPALEHKSREGCGS